MGKKLSAVIVGAGPRAMLYASYARNHPDELEITGVADLSQLRRARVAEKFNLGPAQVFTSAEELARRPKQADFVINGTMDHQHVDTSLPLLAAGYDILLEKPFAVSEAEMWRLVEAVRRHRRRVSVCHVLRYAPFYAAIRREVQAGTIGDIFHLHLTEHVSYHHMAVSHVRGKWRRRDLCHSSMLMAKCCHDLDLMTWLKSGIPPARVASLGGNYQFRADRAPAGAGTRCLLDCPIEADCLYSARKHYIDHPDRWGFYVWASLENIENPTIEDKIASLAGDNPFGRCAWRCDNDVVDHQSVVVDFRDGATGTLNMVGGCAKPSRSIHLVGTRGEIQGCLEDARFEVRLVDPRPGPGYAARVVDLNRRDDTTGAFGGHGGGDLRLVGDFLQVLRGEAPSISSTPLEDSVSGHLLGFRADQAREEGVAVEIEPPEKWGRL